MGIHLQLILTLVILSSTTLGQVGGGTASPQGTGSLASLARLRAAVEEYGRQVEVRDEAQGKLPELEAAESKARHDRDALVAEAEKALEELRLGHYCSECRRPASQIERETGDSFQVHLGKVKGRAIPMGPAEIAKKRAEYERKIQRASERLAIAARRLQTCRDALAAADRAILNGDLSVPQLSTRAALERANERAAERARERQEGAALDRLAADYRAKIRRYETERAALDAWWPANGDLSGRSLEELGDGKRMIAALKGLRRDITARGAELRGRREGYDRTRDEGEARAQKFDGELREVRDAFDRAQGRARQGVQQASPPAPSPAPVSAPPAPAATSPFAHSPAPAPQGPPPTPSERRPSLPDLFDGPDLKVTPSVLPSWSSLADAYNRARDAARAALGRVRKAVDDHADILADAGHELLGDLASGRKLRPLRATVTAWAKDRIGAIGRDLRARAMHGFDYDDLSSSDQIDMDVNDLIRTAVMNPLDYFGRAAWVDRWGRIMDKVRLNIFEGD